MSDFLWCSVKDIGGLNSHSTSGSHHMDSGSGGVNASGNALSSTASHCFDKDGLELALKFFLSSTLTMRLTGINQINQQINSFNEMCNTESVVEIEKVGLQLAGKMRYDPTLLALKRSDL